MKGFDQAAGMLADTPHGSIHEFPAFVLGWG
jgi:hypothetical protein